MSYAGVAVLCLLLALVVALALARDYAQTMGFRTLAQKKALAEPYIRLVLTDQLVRGARRGVAVRPALEAAREAIRNSGMRVLIVDPATMTVEEDTSRLYDARGKRFPIDDSDPDFQQKIESEGVFGSIQLPGEDMRFQYIAQRFTLPARGTQSQQGANAPPPQALQQRQLIVVFAQPQRGLGDLLQEARGNILPAVAVALLVALMAGYLLARSISRPITRLVQASAAMARGDYSQQLQVEGQDEIATLTREFNHMAAEVARAHQMERDFIANISHDLKTPLTSIQGFSQAMLDGAVQDEAGYKQAAAIINEEAQRMSRLVSQLLNLSRLQSGLVSMEMHPVQLAELLGRLVLAMQPQAQSAGVALLARFSVPGAIVLADPDRLKEAFSNLIDNALKYTPRGGNVTVELGTTGPDVEVLVSDTGPGIPQQDLPRVMERFYQVDKARSSTDGRSVGLGLAIAREIVLAHRGQITIQSAQAQGTTVRVVLPGLPAAGTPPAGRGQRLFGRRSTPTTPLPAPTATSGPLDSAAP